MQRSRFAWLFMMLTVALLACGHSDSWQSLEMKASDLRAAGDIAGAIQTEERAVAAAEKDFGESHPNLAISLDNLALLYQSQGDLSKADALYQRAMSIAVNLDPKHRIVSVIRLNRAKFYVQALEFDKARTLYEEALFAAEVQYGSESGELISYIDNLGQVSLLQQRYGDAEGFYQRALDIATAEYGSGAAEAAAQMTNLAVVYTQEGEYAQAEQEHQKAIAIVEAAYGPDDPRIADATYALARTYRIEQRYDDADALYRRLQEILVAAYGESDPALATLYDEWANLYYETGRTTEAGEMKAQANALRETEQQNSGENLK